MELLQYLNSHFYTQQKLLEITRLDKQVFSGYQAEQLMPKASYVISSDIQCESFFGLHKDRYKTEYYAKGYAAWLGMVDAVKDRQKIYTIFCKRYAHTIHHLKSLGHQPSSETMNEGLSEHMEQEWQHFLGGIYGLCTKSGLPEDIAAKELAVAEITELLEQEVMKADDIKKLSKAVNLLDNASALFAPHERQRSSRQTLINETRKKFGL